LILPSSDPPTPDLSALSPRSLANLISDIDLPSDVEIFDLDTNSNKENLPCEKSEPPENVCTCEFPALSMS